MAKMIKTFVSQIDWTQLLLMSLVIIGVIIVMIMVVGLPIWLLTN